LLSVLAALSLLSVLAALSLLSVLAALSLLSELARDVLAIPISSVASECAFSTGGRILD